MIDTLSIALTNTAVIGGSNPMGLTNTSSHADAASTIARDSVAKTL